MRIDINGNVGIGTASCHPNFRCWEIIFTSHRYLLGCSGGVFTGIARLSGTEMMKYYLLVWKKLWTTVDYLSRLSINADSQS